MLGKTPSQTTWEDIADFWDQLTAEPLFPLI